MPAGCLRSLWFACAAALMLGACSKTTPDTAKHVPAARPGAAPTTVEYDPRLMEEARAAARQAAEDGNAAAASIKAGTDYVDIKDGQPYQPLNGKVEVTEFFSYRCPHCSDFQPLLEAWTAQQPGNVRVTSVALGAMNDPLARTYFAALDLKQLPLVHARLFRAIHGDRVLKPNASGQDVAAFLALSGFDGGAYLKAMESDSVVAQLKHALEFAQRSGVDVTPTLVVNGKYRVTGKTPLDNLRIASALVARESGAP